MWFGLRSCQIQNTTQSFISRVNGEYTLCYIAQELVHVALKVKVTSHYDLGVKVFIYTHCQHDSHFLPPWTQSVQVRHPETASLKLTQQQWTVWCWNLLKISATEGFYCILCSEILHHIPQPNRPLPFCLVLWGWSDLWPPWKHRACSVLNVFF